MRGLGDFQRRQRKQITDPRIKELFRHLRESLNIVEDILLRPVKLADSAEPSVGAQIALPIGSEDVTSESVKDLAHSRYIGVSDWCKLSGMGKTATYTELKNGNIKAIKVGTRTLIDVQQGLHWLQTVPYSR